MQILSFFISVIRTRDEYKDENDILSSSAYKIIYIFSDAQLQIIISKIRFHLKKILYLNFFF